MSKLIEGAKKEIPSLDQILEKAWAEINPSGQIISKNFGEVLINLERKANQIYLNYEKRALQKLAESWLARQ